MPVTLLLSRGRHNHIDVKDSVHPGELRAQAGHGLTGCQVCWDSKISIGHQTTSTIFLIIKQLLHILGFLALHLRQQAILLIFRKISQQVSRHVRFHMFQNIRGSPLGDSADQIGLALIIHLLERAGGGLVVKSLQQLSTMAIGHRVGNMSDLRRVEARQLFM